MASTSGITAPATDDGPTVSPDPGTDVATTASGGDVATTDHGKGRTTIAESVVAKIASLAAKEVAGVDTLGGLISGAISGVVGRIRGDEHRTAGVGVEVGERQAAIDLTMTVSYPYPIHETAENVRNNVIDRIESMTGLEVVEVNIAVIDLSFDASNGTGPASSSGTRVE